MLGQIPSGQNLQGKNSEKTDWRAENERHVAAGQITQIWNQFFAKGQRFLRDNGQQVLRLWEFCSLYFFSWPPESDQSAARPAESLPALFQPFYEPVLF